MEPSVVRTKPAESEQLAEYSNALKDYQKTGTKQCLSIINSLLETDVTLTQLKDSKIGSSLKKIIKEEVHNDDEKALKDAIIKLFTKAQKKEEENAQSGDKKPAESKPANGNSTSEQPKKPEAEEQKANPVEENKPKESSLIRRNSENQKTQAVKKEAPKKAPTPIKADPRGVKTLPILDPSYRNFTLQSFSDALLMEYKTNPAEKERLKPTANLKAIDIEKALKEKTSGESEYRMEARNLTTFLMMKTNIELRRKIMDGNADCKEFVHNKENFLNKTARDKMEEVSRKLLDAANADYDKKMVRESSLYQCRKCKSKKISKEEKQTRSGDEPMTSFFKCIDCGAGWKE